MWNDLAPRDVLARLDSASYHGDRQLIDQVLQLQPTIDRLVASYIARGLGQAGFGADLPAESEPFRRQLDERGIAGAKRHWLKILSRIAAERGWATADEPDALAELRQALPFYEIELLLIERCGTSLPGLIESEGTTAIVPLLFADDLMARWYDRAVTFHVFNAIARDALRALIPAAPRPLRVLEVGGGTGGMTRHLLDLLPDDETRYLFTDVGSFFLRAARREFSQFPFVEFQQYDLELPGDEQGLAAGSFDLIVANNVIHDTRNVRDTLRHVARLLAPGGLLLMLELTDPQIWWHMCFGSLEGWWRFKSDPTDHRQDLMLLPKGDWIDLLSDAGLPQTIELSECLQRTFANRLFLSQRAT